MRKENRNKRSICKKKRADPSIIQTAVLQCVDDDRFMVYTNIYVKTASYKTRTRQIRINAKSGRIYTSPVLQGLT